MTKPGTIRHEEIHEKILKEQTFFGASRTCLVNLLMSFILKLLKVYIFSTQAQAMDIIRICYIIEHRADPLTIKKVLFFYFKS